MKNIKLSAVLIVKNEVKKIEKALASLSFCDEIVVIDDGSTDQTQKIINKIAPKAKIIERNLNNDFASQRNFALDIAQGQWILFVDADEVVSSALREEIIGVVNNKDNEVEGYYLKRKDLFLGKWLEYGETNNVKLLRLAKKNSGKWSGKVHETWQIKGPTETLTNPLLHYAHDSINDLTQKISFYSTIRAQELAKEGLKGSWWQIILYPKAKFLQNYFFRLGFLDNMPGLLKALEMSFHSFLVRSKLYMLTRKK